MTTLERQAPAKVNLTLHVTGQRADGYHLLDSLVVFADVSDRLTATPAEDLSLTVSGPFADGVPDDHRNLVLRAAVMLQRRFGIAKGARLHLEKTLPHAAGIGSGSSDAAQTLALLSELWGCPRIEPAAPEVTGLGADVPVCMAAPKPMRMSGIGEVLSPVPPLPDCAVVLVRPPVAVPTGVIFQGLATKQGQPMEEVSSGMSLADFANWLQAQRNDLLPPALAHAPQIGQAIDRLRAAPDVAFAGMSGSGATCFGLTARLNDAQELAAKLSQDHPEWWVTAGRLLA